MGRLANISSAEALRAFERAGWHVSHQTGSHMILTKPGSLFHLSLPRKKESAAGTLRSLIRDAGLTIDEFLALL